MWVSHLKLQDFRNFHRLDLPLGPGPTVFLGDNAQGKSNLLEALYVLATTRSPRAGAEAELLRWEAQGEALPLARLEAQVRRPRGPVALEVLLVGPAPTEGGGQGPAPTEGGGQGPAQKRLRVNGVPRRALDYLGELVAVLFSAADLEMLAGAPGLRRRFLDVACGQGDRAYLRALQRYGRVLSQRNSLLKLIGSGRGRVAELEFWDEELSLHGSYLLGQRRSLLAALGVEATAVHRALTGSPAQLALEYQATLSPAEGQDAPSFRRALLSVQGRELAAGFTLVGPHRDDLRLLLGGRGLAQYGSRGELRTAALALRLAEATLLRRALGEAPALLLDDVLSELDGGRRRLLQEFIAPYEQVLLTAVDREALAPGFLEGAARHRVRAGAVERE